MDQFDLNLSTRPFKPYRAANFGLFVLLLVLIAISVWQFFNYQYYSALADASRAEEQEVRATYDQLSAQVQKLNERMASGNATVKLSEVETLNGLLLRKSFSWTSVFATLERIMPDNVRLLSLRPFLNDGVYGLTIQIRARSLSDATAFLRSLEDSDIFQDVTLMVEEKIGNVPSGEVEFTLTSSYIPPGQAKPQDPKPQAKVVR